MWMRGTETQIPQETGTMIALYFDRSLQISTVSVRLQSYASFPYTY